MIKKKLKQLLFLGLTLFAGRSKSAGLADANELQNIKKILVIRQDNRIGNIMFITPLLTLIRQQTGAKADVLMGTKFSELLEKSPDIGNIYQYRGRDIANPIKFLNLIMRLRKENYDLLIDCKDCFSFNNGLLAAYIKAKRKIGFAKLGANKHFNFALELSNKNNLMHESIYLAQPFLQYFKLNQDVEVPTMCLKQQEISTEQGKKIFKLSRRHPIVGIHLGGRKQKSIDVGLVNSVVRILKEYQITPLLIYGPDELEKVKGIDTQGSQILIKPDNMQALAEIIKACEVFVSPDTGPLHIASALNKPIVAIFNCDNEVRYGPRNKQENLVINTEQMSQMEILNLIDEYFAKELDPTMPEAA